MTNRELKDMGEKRKPGSNKIRRLQRRQNEYNSMDIALSVNGSQAGVDRLESGTRSCN